jgi:hypothetical protein
MLSKEKEQVMAARFSIKSILAVSAVLVMSIWSTTAGAYTIGGTGLSSCTYNPLTKTTSCSIDATAVLSGLRNTAKTPTAYVVTLGIISGSIFCTNPADNSIHANGQPFQQLLIPIKNGQAITPNTITRNGHALADIKFEDPELIAALANAGFVVTCQNSNWNQRIIVTDVRAFGQIVTDDSAAAPTCQLSTDPVNTDGCTPVDNLLNSCVLPDPYFNDPQQALGTVVPYTCTQICHSTDYNACNFNTGL